MVLRAIGNVSRAYKRARYFQPSFILIGSFSFLPDWNSYPVNERPICVLEACGLTLQVAGKIDSNFIKKETLSLERTLLLTARQEFWGDY